MGIFSLLLLVSALELVSYQIEEGNCSLVGSELHCDIGDLENGSVVRLRVTLRALNDGPTLNTVTVFTDTFEEILGNNQSKVRMG